MKYLSFLFVTVLSLQISAQSTFSKLITLDSDFQQGQNVIARNGIIYVLAEKECEGLDSDCGVLFQMNEDGEVLFQHNIDDFELGSKDNLNYLEDELIVISGHSNSEAQDTAMYALVFDEIDQTAETYKFTFGSTYGELANRGFLLTQNESLYAPIFYGSNSPDGKKDAFLAEVPEEETIKMVHTWDEGQRDYDIIKANLINDTTVLFAADIIPTGTTLTFRSIKTITLGGTLTTIWESPFILDLGTTTDFIYKADGSYVIITPNEENAETKLSPFIISIDKEGNENWTFEFSTDDAEIVERSVYDIEETANGDIIGIGAIEHEAIGKDIGWIFRISSEGELMWERSYSDYDWFNDKYQSSTLFKITELADGSLVGTGFMNQTAFSVSKEDVWILKVGEDGCFSSGDCGFEQNTASIVNQALSAKLIYPNPVTDVLTIIYDDISSYQLSGLNGKVLLSGQENEIDVRNIQSGVYYLNVVFDSGDRAVTRIVKI